MSTTVPTPVPQKNGFGVTALVTGLIGILLSWIPFIGFFGFILAAIAIVFGAVGFVQARKGRASQGLAIAGLVLGIAAFVISIAVWASTANSIDRALNTPASSGPALGVTAPGAQTRLEAWGDGPLHVSYSLGNSFSTEDVTAPWSKDGPSGAMNSLTVSRTSMSGPTGEIGCRITVNGKVIKQQTASGQVASANCL